MASLGGTPDPFGVCGAPPPLPGPVILESGLPALAPGFLVPPPSPCPRSP